MNPTPVDLFDGDAVSAPSLARHLRAATPLRLVEEDAAWVLHADDADYRAAMVADYATTRTAAGREHLLLEATAYDAWGGAPSLVDELLALDTARAVAA